MAPSSLCLVNPKALSVHSLSVSYYIIVVIRFIYVFFLLRFGFDKGPATARLMTYLRSLNKQNAVFKFPFYYSE